MNIPGRIIHRDRVGKGEIIVADDGMRRSLYLDGDTLQSCMYLDRPAILVMEYSHAMMCALLFVNQPRRILLIGLGGASLVRFLLELLPDTFLEVAEINPRVIEAARQFFSLAENDGRLQIIPQPGEELVQQRLTAGESYDLVLADAFDDHGAARALLERPFLDSCRRLLADRGVFAMNLWNRPQDRFPAIFEVIAEVFRDKALKLALAESYRNVIAFGFPFPIRAKDLHRLRPTAKKLGQRSGINLAKYLRALYCQNFRN